ncbi:MAG TPA: hypothetical protein PK388_06875, partial [Kiritimatiellia bacterium]|nr:hypothetical protein [Kiritimatiellia bacterium]
MFREYTPRPPQGRAPDNNPFGRKTGNTGKQDNGRRDYSCFPVFPAQLPLFSGWSFATAHRILSRMISNTPLALSLLVLAAYLLGSIPNGL